MPIYIHMWISLDDVHVVDLTEVAFHLNRHSYTDNAVPLKLIECIKLLSIPSNICEKKNSI